MNLKSCLFYDQTDDIETEVVCESIDTALLIKAEPARSLFLYAAHGYDSPT